MRAILSLFTLLLVVLICASALAGLARVTGILPEQPPTIIRIVHTTSGCQL